MKGKRLGDAAKPGNYEVNSAFCETQTHAKFEARRLEQQQAQQAAMDRARAHARNMGTEHRSEIRKPKSAKAQVGGVPASVGKDGKVYLSKAARKKLKKAAKAFTKETR
mmetsp:Transcript_17532/g.58742  ORF Transcript_17532/g.58742 Transcript_17532/m.58742 type:complete len:109 (+) Transcript_17532:56-382(+)